METVDTVNLVVAINGKRDTIQTLAANNASEAVWMIRLACSSKNTIQDRFFAYRALFKCILKEKTIFHKIIEKFPHNFTI